MPLTRLAPNHVIARVFVLCYFLISATYGPEFKISTAEHRDLSGTASIYILRNQISVQKGSSATLLHRRGKNRRWENSKTVHAHFGYLSGTSFPSERSPRCQMAICRPRPRSPGPPATDPKPLIACLSTLIHYLLSIAQHFCHLQDSRDLVHEFLDPKRWV